MTAAAVAVVLLLVVLAVTRTPLVERPLAVVRVRVPASGRRQTGR